MKYVQKIQKAYRELDDLCFEQEIESIFLDPVQNRGFGMLINFYITDNKDSTETIYVEEAVRRIGKKYNLKGEYFPNMPIAVIRFR